MPDIGVKGVMRGHGGAWRSIYNIQLVHLEARRKGTLKGQLSSPCAWEPYLV